MNNIEKSKKVLIEKLDEYKVQRITNILNRQIQLRNEIDKLDDEIDTVNELNNIPVQQGSYI